jgi:hypothetical protein
MLPSMAKYMMETAGKSIISRVYGVFKVKYPGMNRIYLMLQRNNMQLKKHNELLNSFDLKGSTYRRKVISELKLQSMLDKNYINKKSVGRDSSDSRKIGDTMNKTNIVQKLRLSSGTGSIKRKSSSHKRVLDESDEQQLQMEEIKTKQKVLRKLGKSTLKDVDFERLVRKNVLSLSISE